MKTAMQFMLSYIEAIQNDDFNSDIEYIKENCIQLLDTEKTQIMNAYNKGYSNAEFFYLDVVPSVRIEKFDDAKIYYRETFKE